MGKFYVKVNKLTKDKALDVGERVSIWLAELSSGPCDCTLRELGVYAPAMKALMRAGIVEYDGKKFRLVDKRFWSKP